MKRILVLDFDGVIHRYGQGDRGNEIYDVPTPGALEFVRAALKKFDIYILSSRAASESGRVNIANWLKKYEFPGLPCSNQKPDGEIVAFIDDRAIPFRGEFPSVKSLASFHPWWEK